MCKKTSKKICLKKSGLLANEELERETRQDLTHNDDDDDKRGRLKKRLNSWK